MTTLCAIKRYLVMGFIVGVTLFAVQAITANEADAATYYEQDALANTALSYEGTPYSWNPAVGFTCSGFTQHVYQEALGVYIPPDPYGQLAYGYAVSDLQPGDLVFYDSYLDGGIDHVAIYVGDGMVMDSNTYTGAVSYRGVHEVPGYVTARRIL